MRYTIPNGIILLCITVLSSGCVSTTSTKFNEIDLLLSSRITKLERDAESIDPNVEIDLDPIYKEIKQIKTDVLSLQKDFNNLKVQKRKVENKIINTVWIKMKNKSMRPIKLIKINDYEWIGPKQEVYDHLPTERELKLLYRT